MEHQISIHDLPAGKMLQEHLEAQAAGTSKQSCRRSAPSVTREHMCLDLRSGYGNLLGAYWETDIALLGVSTMLNTGEFPSDERESTLSQILDLNAPEKYCLSKTACAGILRRAKERKKTLPSLLMAALTEVVGSDG